MTKGNFYTYILKSERSGKYYVGQTSDLENRLKFHNNGYQNYTKKFLPWILILAIPKETRKEAVILENKLKNLNTIRREAFIEKYK